MNATGTRAEFRAAETRGFYEQQRAMLGAGAARVILPRQLAPMAKGRIAELLGSGIDEPTTNAHRSAAVAGLGHRADHDLVPALVGEQGARDMLTIGVSDNQCPCCVARTKLPGEQARVVKCIAEHKTQVDFKADVMLTTVTTTMRVAAKWIDWKKLVNSCNPKNWKTQASEYFQKSDPVPGKFEEKADGCWTGQLHEVFEWQWNPDSEAMFDNYLFINFSHGTKEKENERVRFVRCDYDLYQSNSSKLWTARESGGLDVDGGFTEATLSEEWVKVIAQKQIRFTDPELGPPGLGAMLNYMAPTLTGLWMHHTVQAGIEKSIVPAPNSEDGSQGGNEDDSEYRKRAS